MDQEKIELTFETPAAPAAALETALPSRQRIRPCRPPSRWPKGSLRKSRKWSMILPIRLTLPIHLWLCSMGAASQKKIADFSESALENVRTKDMGEVGDMITGLMTELKGFSVDEEEKGGFFGFFKKTRK